MWLQLLPLNWYDWLLWLLRLETAIMARQLSCWSWCNSHLPKKAITATAIPDPGFHAATAPLLAATCPAYGYNHIRELLLPPPQCYFCFQSFSCCHSRKLLLPPQSLHLILIATTWLVLLHHDVTTHILSYPISYQQYKPLILRFHITPYASSLIFHSS